MRLVNDLLVFMVFSGLETVELNRVSKRGRGYYTRINGLFSQPFGLSMKKAELTGIIVVYEARFLNIKRYTGVMEQFNSQNNQPSAEEIAKIEASRLENDTAATKSAAYETQLKRDFVDDDNSDRPFIDKILGRNKQEYGEAIDPMDILHEQAMTEDNMRMAKVRQELASMAGAESEVIKKSEPGEGAAQAEKYSELAKPEESK
jgi:hypothetical protein